MGVIAANHAMKTMRIVRNTGMEHLIAVVETNSCFSDARFYENVFGTHGVSGWHPS